MLGGGASGPYRFRRVRTPGQPGGYLSVALVEATGALVAGGTAAVAAPDGIVTDAGFSGYRPFVTSGPPGEWTVTVVPPTGYALASGQPNPARVAVTAGPRETELRVGVVRVPGP